MIPYVLLIFLPLFIATFINNFKTKNMECYERKQNIQETNCLISIFFVLLFILLSLRDETIGRDLDNYRYYFEKISQMSRDELLQYNLDVLYTILVWSIGKLTDNYQIFLVIIAAITVFPIAVTYNQDKQHSFLKVVLYMNMSTFIMLFSGLRQSIAIAIGVIAYEFVKRKKPMCFLLFALIAWGFHHSAFMILIFYPLYHVKFKKKHLWFVIPCILVVFAFNKQIFTWATNLIGGEKYIATTISTGAYTMLILFALFAVFSYIIPDEKKMDNETLGLRNFLLLSILLQSFSPVHNLAMRMNYYFIIFIPMLIPKVITCAKENLKDIAYVSKIILTIFFVSYYLINTYNSCRTGISALDTYPYVPFWK